MSAQVQPMRLSEAHTEAAWFGLAREYQDPVVLARFTIDGEPISKARARHTRAGVTYSPEANRKAEQVIGWKFRAAAKTSQPDAVNAFGVVAIFFSATQQRRDVDNMLKLILDGLNKVAWVDDNQVLEISGRKGYVDERDDARTEVVVYDLGPMPRRTGRCEQCGAEFPAFRSQSERRYCTRACVMAARIKKNERQCARCGQTFSPRKGQSYCSAACRRLGHTLSLVCIECGSTYQRWASIANRGQPLCSKACSAAYWRRQRAANAKGTCAACGGPTSKKSYVRCRACVSGGVEVT